VGEWHGYKLDADECMYGLQYLGNNPYSLDESVFAKEVSSRDNLWVQSLDDISSEFDPINDADSNYGRVIGIKVASRTNPAIAEDMDVSAYKARAQMLYDLDGVCLFSFPVLLSLCFFVFLWCIHVHRFLYHNRWGRAIHIEVLFYLILGR